MRKYINGLDFDLCDVQMQYGIEPKLKDEWENVIKIADDKERHRAIDRLIEILESNSENNGFFNHDQEISINKLFGQIFKIDDKKIYYNFFDFLKENISKQNDDEKQNAGFVIMKTIYQTVKDYFGDTSNLADRFNISTVKLDKDDNIKVPCMQDFKHKNAAACIEMASVSHNLWLMSGVTSYFVLSKSASIDKTSGHAFDIVFYKNKYKLFDIAMEKYKMLDQNVISNLENGKPMVVDNFIYANKDALKDNESAKHI